MPILIGEKKQVGPAGAGLVAVDGRTYPLESAAIQAQAEGGVARTRLVQRYRNPYPEALETRYTLALPARGAVTGYKVRLGDREIVGEVQKREEAAEEYRQAIAEGRIASLLEQDRADVFEQKLGSLPAGALAEIEIEVLQPLEFLTVGGGEDMCWEYRFPTVTGVRYHGAPGRVPDRDRLDPDRADPATGTPARVEISLRIGDGPAEKTRPQCLSHRLRWTDSDDAIVGTLDEASRLDRDLVIRWAAVEAEVGATLRLGTGLEGDEGRYGLLTIVPPKVVGRTWARDLTLLIDCSGSMSGFPIAQARRLARELLASLGEEDRFEVLAFSSDTRRLTGTPQRATRRGVAKAIAAVERLRAGGGTEMASALVEALEPLRGDSERQVVLITDGQVGFERQVTSELLGRSLPAVRVHTVGIGPAPNRSLTAALARAGRGEEVLVASEDDVDDGARRLLAATVGPVLTDVKIGGTAVKACAPELPADVLAGKPLRVTLELGPEAGSVRVLGVLAGTSEPWTCVLPVPAVGAKGSAEVTWTAIPIGALHGRERVEDLEMRSAATGPFENPLDEKIEAAGLRHRIATRMTSLVAVELEPSVDPKEPRRRVRLPLEVPAGASVEGLGLLGAPPAWDQAAMVLGGTMAALENAQSISSEFSSRSGDVARLASRARARMLRWFRNTRTLRIEDQVLVFELDVPEDGFVLPEDGGEVRVHFPGDVEARACLLGRDSSPRGPHQAGLTVRIALLLQGDARWHHDEALLRWERAGRSAGDDFVIHLRIPPNFWFGGGRA